MQIKIVSYLILLSIVCFIDSNSVSRSGVLIGWFLLTKNRNFSGVLILKRFKLSLELLATTYQCRTGALQTLIAVGKWL